MGEPQKEGEWFKEKKPGTEVVEASMFFDTTTSRLYEQVFDGRNCSFVYINGGDAHHAGEIGDVGDASTEKKLVPIDNDALRKGAVMLPEKAEDYGTEGELIDELIEFIKKYLDIGDEFTEYAAYYILLSWLADKLNTVPYLRVIGDLGNGKTRFLDVIGRLCYKPIITAGTATPAVIYRLMGVWNGTMLIDEADRKQSDTADEVVKILNCGFEKGCPVLRCDKDNNNDIEVHSVYGPKVISSRHPFYDKALESRCITYHIKETARKDIPWFLTPSFHRAQMDLRNKLLMFRLVNYADVDIEQIENFARLKEMPIEPRMKQTASAFLLILKNPEVRGRFEEFLKKYNKELVEERSESVEGWTVEAYNELHLKGIVTATDMAYCINTKKSPGYELTGRKMSRYLKELGFTTQLVRDGADVKRAVDINDEVFSRLRRKYMPDAETFLV